MAVLRGRKSFSLLKVFLCFFALAWPVTAQESAKVVQHTFIFKSDKPLKSVAVAGTFNGWNKNANTLKADADGRTWRATVPLNYGKYLYKFLLDETNWIVDPAAKTQENDGEGHQNSVLLIAPPDYQIPASPNDGKTAKSALLHESRVPFLNYDQGKLIFALRARPYDLRQVILTVEARRYAMKPIKSDDLYAWYQAEIELPKLRDLDYNFELQDGAKKTVFSAKLFRFSAKDFKPYQVPNWVEKTVFYQIFPDRFANGDKTNDPPNAQAWDSAPNGFSRFGGDVAGVRQHLPYIKDLGVSAVYFNPVFKSPSNHRYDAEDYKTIDPQFGTNAEFSALTQELKQQNIRTVMDFVFNHTATTFAAFADVRQKGENSTFKDWYFIKSFPLRIEENPNYVAWNNYRSMPKLNLLNPATSDYMLDLVNYWKREVPLAGLRLDVAGEVDMRFWRKLRTRVKNLDSQMWIVGEVWGDGSPWLQGDQWDSVMNYQFREACVQFFADGKTSPTQFIKRLMQIHQSYLPQVSRNMMSLLSSHDTPRFLTLCGNNTKLHQLAATVQFTWVGAPSIYYGEELGMQGGGDPDNRRGMEWDKATPDNEMLRFYKKLIAIRNSSRALQAGAPSILLADDKTQTIVYARTLKNEAAIVVLNRSNAPQTVEFALPRNAAFAHGFVEALGPKPIKSDGKMRLQLAPLSSAILLSPHNAAP